ncbi:hypothetical protein [Labilibaculum sp.]|uniref:hypothetical protein n=1 Tax=Labilibaculum sp. TaxID=2060723 RepID=UPI002AA7B950|nr:hypothetical protein [Labilibaculum sp.]
MGAETIYYDDIRATPLFLSLTYKYYEDAGAKAPKKMGAETIYYDDIRATPLFLSPTCKYYEDIGAKAPKKRSVAAMDAELFCSYQLMLCIFYLLQFGFSQL